MAMSGGVDSSTSAKMLKDGGYEVLGATMLLSESLAVPSDNAQNQADGLDDAYSVSKEARDARENAIKLGIEHRVFDLRDAFQENVIAPFCKGYINGETPNPCIDCNISMKFGLFDAKREELGLDYLATGHYAKREFDPALGRFVLKQGADSKKDQSYVLAFLSQDVLAHTLFPLGETSKGEVRKIAGRSKLTNADAPESQDICFIKDGKYAAFIERWFGEGSEPGPILDESGKLLGHHVGLLHYTIGQRKGLGIAAPYPLYVVEKDVGANALVVGPKESLEARQVSARDANLVTYLEDEVAGKALSGWAKTHYRHKGQSCKAVFGENGSLDVTFDEPVTKPAKGQTLVVYDGDTVIGAGIIM